jgi:uncharacterized hydrophobic protein (TIGR00271 family)
MTTQGGAAAPRTTATTLPDARMSLGAAKLADLFPEPEAFRRSLVTFAVLLGLAGLIAAFGLYQDSVASIIGAMVVAPLGGTIMAFAGALVTARTRWMWITFVQVTLGALGVIAIGYLVSLVLPDILTLTPSLEARTSPGLLDLGVALSAGAAGAYVAARRTGTDALPGVAIAVSLVPPLATVGICLELGRPDAAAGALLLFVTNFAAIVVAACVVFTLSGLAPSREAIVDRNRVRNGFILAVVALAIIAIPLAITGFQRGVATLDSTKSAPVVKAWIGPRTLAVREWSIDGNAFTLVIEGPDAPGDTGTLATDLANAVGHRVDLEVRYVPTVVTRASGG